MANGGRADTVITIKAEETEWLLHPLAGNESCCIFRVPQFLAEIHPKIYQPHIVSIGPYHYGKPHLKMMQQHKQRYLRKLLARTPPTGPKLDDYLQAVASREQDIRDCYSENIEFGSGDLVEMMVLDGLFIIELFCKESGLVPATPSHGDDPIFNLAWVKPNLIRDLLRLENQVPFFILQILFDKSKPLRNDEPDDSLVKLALEFISQEVGVVNQKFKDKPYHLLDLLRLSFIPQPLDHPSHPPLDGIKTESVKFILSATKLYQSGIKFRTVEEAMGFLDIRFSKGVLEIPNITLDDLRADLFLNFVAFEQHRYFHCERHITSYAAFMGCLIRTPEDATFLRENNIIENYLGTDEEVANFFRSIGKDVTFDIDESHLCKLFKDVNEYQRNVWHVRWAGFKFTYFDTPWSFLSALAAVILLLLTVLQTFYAVYAYYHPQ